jgi:hypothetical protein
MNNNDNDIFEMLIALLAIGFALPLAGVGIYATITALFL